MITKPTQLPALRADQLNWLMGQGQTFFAKAIKAGKQPIRPNLSDDKAALHLAREEARRLHKAELFWVDSAMADLARTAADAMPPFALQPEDLPAPAGLIVFEDPIRTMPAHEDYADAIHVRAASWGPAPAKAGGDLWVSWYTDTAMNFESVDPRRLATAMQVPLSKVASLPTWRELGMPALSYEIEELLWFSDVPLPYADPTTGEEKPGSNYPLKELVTTWNLMQQPIAKEASATFDRPTRRRMQRQNVEPSPVRVITLRRPNSSSDHGEADREYHHRWIVRGHWRQQWYPSRQVHRPVWIAPHIKGPDDAPFIGGEKVHAWRR